MKIVNLKTDSFKKPIIKSNNFILAQFKMTTYEQKIVLLCISKIKKNAKKTPFNVENIDLTFDLSAKEIGEFLKLCNKTIYKDLDEISEKLMSHRIIIRGNKGFEKINPIPYCKYDKGVFTLRFDYSMQDYLIELKDKFTVYNIENVRNLKSNYSIRLYEILKSYEWLKECTFEIIDIKKIIGIIRVDKDNNLVEDLYSNYADLKKRVFVIAQKELADKTDIKFEFDEIKSGRKVTHIHFVIESNIGKIEALENIESKVPEIININELEVEDKNILSLIEKLEEIIDEPIKTKDLKSILKAANNDIDLIKTKYQISKKQRGIGNLTAWLIAAIKSDYKHKTQQTKKPKSNKFINYEQSKWNFEQLEILEREYVDTMLKK